MTTQIPTAFPKKSLTDPLEPTANRLNNCFHVQTGSSDYSNGSGIYQSYQSTPAERPALVCDSNSSAKLKIKIISRANISIPEISSDYATPFSGLSK
jgi:hypothetical protein